MIFLKNDNTTTLKWTIFKGASDVKEDFSNTLLKVFIVSSTDKIPLHHTIQNNDIIATVPPGLTPGVYSVESIWVKNIHRNSFEGRDLGRSKIEDAFAFTNIEGEATNNGDTVLKLTSRVATYGYDGLNAYELNVLYGKWGDSMSSWLNSKGGQKVTTDDIEDGAVTWDKLSADIQSEFELAQYVSEFLQSLGGDEHFRGAWSADEVYNKFDLVYHLGCKWMCLLDNTTEEPTWYADTWLYMSGDNRFKIDIDSSAGTSFRGSDIDTTFTVTLWFGSFNVTEKFGNQNGRKVVWSRDTGNATKDKAWSPTYVGSNGMKLRIRLYDVGLDFRERGYTSFTITLGIPTSSGYDQVTRTINIK